MCSSINCKKIYFLFQVCWIAKMWRHYAFVMVSCFNWVIFRVLESMKVLVELWTLMSNFWMNENNPANSSIDPCLPVLAWNFLDWAWVRLDAAWRAPVKDILLHCFKVTLSGKIYLKQWRPWTSLSHICYKIVQLQQQVPCSWGEQWAFTFTTWISPAPVEYNLMMKHIWYETAWYDLCFYLPSKLFLYMFS